MDSSLHHLYNYLLNLDYFKELLVEDVNQPELPEQQPLEVKDAIADVPLDFIDVADYHKVWEPLFFVEARANVLKSLQAEAGEYVECRIVKVAEQNEYFLMEVLCDVEVNIYAHDLVLFATAKPEGNDQVPHAIAVTEGKSRTIRLFLAPLKSQNERVVALQNGIKKNMELKVPFYVRKLCQMSTIEREFRALQNLGHVHLRTHLLHPKKFAKTKHNYFDIPARLKHQLDARYNQSQVDAIRETLKTHGITLIQGPPGTGKTKTVIGTVSVLLSSFEKQPTVSKTQSMEVEEDGNLHDRRHRSPWLCEDYDDWRNHIFDEIVDDVTKYFGFSGYSKANATDNVIQLQRREDSEYKAPDRILVCGPSNASVDEIVKKVLENGVMDENGNDYHPFIVRIGENYDSSIAHVSLDNLVKQRMLSLKNEEESHVQNQILQQARIVFGTLSSAGSQVLAGKKYQFDTVIIDEAAQAVEVSTLIPIQYGCKRLIMIGDPNQLPATVFSKTAERHKYSLSLFERLQRNSLPIHMLKTQYRMHPLISTFISRSFYKAELNDAPNLMELIGTPELYNSYTFTPLVVFHVKGREEFHRNSYRNDAEAQAVCQLIADLLRRHPKVDLTRVGVVSPYSSQIVHMQKQLKRVLPGELPLEVKTVDGFQGREKDVIIFSTVRSTFLADGQPNPQKSIGFLKDPRRMNVSLSRCRQSLVVVADIYKLRSNRLWRDLVEYAFSLGTCYKLPTKGEDWVGDFNRDPLHYQIKAYTKKQVNKTAE